MPKERTSKVLKRHERLERHKELMKAYLDKKNASVPKSYIPSVYKTERDIIRENHRFVRSDEDKDKLSWEEKVAKNYYDRLYKEYALCNLKYYKEGKIALRWRTEKEVVSGKGQFACGSTHCEETKHLESWEVNFGYVEDGEKKNELVKVRLCERCSHKLNYKTKMKSAKREAKHRDRQKSKSRKTKEYGSDSSETGIEKSSRSNGETDSNNNQEKERSVWSKKVEIQQEKTQEEEYEDYFADLLQ